MRSGRSSRGFWARAITLWSGVRDKRRTATTARSLLRPGVYRPLSETLWTRPGARIPAHLRRTKGGGPSGTVRVSRPYRFLRLVAGTFLVLGCRRGRTADLVVASFDGGIVVLDRERKRIHRTYGTGRLTPADARRRRVFTDYVSAPQFWLRDGGAAVEEELVDGAYLGDLTHDEREELVTTLVEQFAALTSAYTSDPAPITDRDLQSLLHEAQVPPEFARTWASSSTAWFRHRTPWVPSPREANAKNLVVRPDGRPAPIDLGDLQIDPYFSYPVGILIAGGGEVMRRFLSGAADFSFPALFEAAEQRWGATPDERRGLLLARITYAAYRDSSVGGDVDHGIFEDSLRRRWDEVRYLFDESVEPARRRSPGQGAVAR